MTCWQNLQVRVQVQVHSFQVQVQVRVLRAKVQVQVQVQQKGLKSGLESKSGLEYYKSAPSSRGPRATNVYFLLRRHKQNSANYNGEIEYQINSEFST